MEATQQGARGTGWAGSARWFLGGEQASTPQIPSKLISLPRPLNIKLWENERFKQLLRDERQMRCLESLSSWEPPWPCCFDSGCGGSCTSELGQSLGRMRYRRPQDTVVGTHLQQSPVKTLGVGDEEGSRF